MIVKCSNCGAVHNIEDSKIPEKGAYATCRDCKNRFFVVKQKDSNIISNTNLKNKKSVNHKSDDKCPKCGHIKIEKVDTCPNCGIVYEKYGKTRICPNIRCKAERKPDDKRCPRCGIYYEEHDKYNQNIDDSSISVTKNKDFSISKVLGIIVIFFGIISSFLFFNAGLKFSNSGDNLTKLRSVDGKTVAEAYYQEVGRYGKAYSQFSYALGFLTFAICSGIGGNLYTKKE